MTCTCPHPETRTKVFCENVLNNSLRNKSFSEVNNGLMLQNNFYIMNNDQWITILADEKGKEKKVSTPKGSP